MRKRWTAVAWVLSGATLASVYLTKRPHWQARSAMRQSLSQATTLERAGELDQSRQALTTAIQSLPASATTSDRFRLRLQRASIDARLGQVGQALTELKSLQAESAGGAIDEILVQDLRRTLGRVSYYAAWQLRRTDAAETVWRPVADTARQQFALLAEGSDQQAQRDLERTIRLIQTNDTDLTSLPFPEEGGPGQPDLSQQIENASQNRRGRPSDDRNGNPDPNARPGNGAGNNRTNHRGS